MKIDWLGVVIYLSIGWTLAFSHNYWATKHCPEKPTDAAIISIAVMWPSILAGSFIYGLVFNPEKVCTK